MTSRGVTGKMADMDPGLGAFMQHTISHSSTGLGIQAGWPQTAQP
jgi:hypothetical protein